MNINVTSELAEKIVPTALPLNPKPLDSEVSHSWKNDHHTPHDAKNSNKVNELCR